MSEKEITFRNLVTRDSWSLPEEAELTEEGDIARGRGESPEGGVTAGGAEEKRERENRNERCGKRPALGFGKTAKQTRHNHSLGLFHFLKYFFS